MANSNERDEQRIARAIAGDKEAFGDLYELFLDEIYHYVFYRVNSREEAEDITESVFLRAWQALFRNPPKEIPFRLWLYRIAHNAVVDFYRSRNRNVIHDQLTEFVDPGHSPEQEVGNREEITLLESTMRQLKVEHQQVLACRFFAGLSHKETAVVMLRDEQAVRALQYRAINALRNLLISREGFHV